MQLMALLERRSLADCFNRNAIAFCTERLNLTQTPQASWLSAPGSAALALLYLNRPAAALLGLKASAPRRVIVKSRFGETLDEAMAAESGDGVLLTCHGGAAVRRALEHELAALGVASGADFWQAPSRFEREMLALLPALQGRAAVSLALDALAHGCAALAGLRDEQRSACAAAGPAMAQSRRLLEAPRVQLWGPANAGKSSLLNALCGEPLAEVADEPGLTRDVIEGRVEHRGFVLRLFDAPGEIASAAGVDSAALELARRWRESADLVLRLVPPGAAPKPESSREWIIFSRGDQDRERRQPSVSVHDARSLDALKDRLISHFLDGLQSLHAPWRYALPAALREDLHAWAEGSLALSTLKQRWTAPADSESAGV
jgi:hypothetical protein